MDRTTTCFLAILLPLLASCSSTLGIAKKTNGINSEVKATAVADTRTPGTGNQSDGAFHIAGKGETLRHVCDVYGLDINKVAKINKILPPYALKEGETIFLPAYALLADSKDPCGKPAGPALNGPREKCIAGEVRSSLVAAMSGRPDPAVPGLSFPVPGGKLTSPFGHRWGRFHRGLDIAAPVGQPVLACAPGKVIFTGSRKRFRRYGNTVLIDHGKGVYTYYAHLSEILVKNNETVRRGRKIALVGETGRATGPHLHLEVRVGNRMYNPLAYFSPSELTRTRVAKRFTDSPMGPVRAGWRIPDLLVDSR